MNWADFFNMGGYAFFVWSSWGLTVLALILNIVLPNLKNRSIKNSIKREYSRERRNSLEQNKNAKSIKSRNKKLQK